MNFKGLLLFLGLLIFPLQAQAQLLTTGVSNVTTSGGGGFTGPGDIQTFASWYGTYAYSAAKRGTKVANVCNVADVVCVDVLSDATTGIAANPTIGGVTCGTTGGVNVCTVKTWYDQAAGTGGGDMTQTTISNRSKWVPAGSCTGLGASISCTDQTIAQYTSAGTISISQPFSFTWTANRNASTSTETNIMYNGSNIVVGGGFGNINNDSFCTAGAGGLDTSSTDASWHAVSCAINGVSTNIKVDSGSVVTGNAGTNNMSSFMSLLVNYNVGNFWQGKFASAGVGSGAFTNTDLANLNANAHTILGF